MKCRGCNTCVALQSAGDIGAAVDVGDKSKEPELLTSWDFTLPAESTGTVTNPLFFPLPQLTTPDAPEATITALPAKPSIGRLVCPPGMELLPLFKNFNMKFHPISSLTWPHGRPCTIINTAITLATTINAPAITLTVAPSANTRMAANGDDSVHPPLFESLLTQGECPPGMKLNPIFVYSKMKFNRSRLPEDFNGPICVPIKSKTVQAPADTPTAINGGDEPEFIAATTPLVNPIRTEAPVQACDEDVTLKSHRVPGKGTPVITSHIGPNPTRSVRIGKGPVATTPMIWIHPICTDIPVPVQARDEDSNSKGHGLPPKGNGPVINSEIRPVHTVKGKGRLEISMTEPTKGFHPTASTGVPTTFETIGTDVPVQARGTVKGKGRVVISSTEPTKVFHPTASTGVPTTFETKMKAYTMAEV